MVVNHDATGLTGGFGEALHPEADLPNEVLADRRYAPVGKLDSLDLAGYGYRWIRLRRAAAFG